MTRPAAAHRRRPALLESGLRHRVFPFFADLVAQSRSAGIAVRLEWTGEDLTGESPTARRGVDRAICEALTDVHKHAAAADVQVVVRREPRQIRVDVRNGPESPAARTAPLAVRAVIPGAGGAR